MKDLVSILTSYDDGWPAWIMTSRVTMLAKRENCIEENHTRPITVTSLLWRWWASTLARQVLAKWATTLPPSVLGGVPNSSVHDVAMQTHLAIEQAHASGTSVAGFTLDIVKCFNCIPRHPTRMLLRRLGIPETIVQTWYGSLQRLTRVIDVGGNLSNPITSTTGLPEGCPISVLGMAAIAWAFAISVQQNQVQVLTFYDNWSWISSVMGTHQETLERTIRFDPFDCADDWTAFTQLGNQIADEAAKAAMRAIPGDLTGAARKIYIANKANKAKLATALGYASRVAIKYLQMCQTKADEDAGAGTHQEPAQKLLHWNPPLAQTFDFEVPAANLESYAWGTAFALSACKVKNA